MVREVLTLMLQLRKQRAFMYAYSLECLTNGLLSRVWYCVFLKPIAASHVVNGNRLRERSSRIWLKRQFATVNREHRLLD